MAVFLLLLLDLYNNIITYLIYLSMYMALGRGALLTNLGFGRVHPSVHTERPYKLFYILHLLLCVLLNITIIII